MWLTNTYTIRIIVHTMRYSELKRLLRKNGCYKTSEGARHEEWYSPTDDMIGKKSKRGRFMGSGKTQV